MNHPPPRAVVLAGGFGTRIKHLLPGIPKPMAPVAGKPFVEWVLRHLRRSAGITDFVLSTGYLAETVEAYFRTPPDPGMKVRCCAETTPLGTAGGFLHCVDTEGEAPPALWLVANGDSLALANLAPVVEAVQAPGTAAAILALEVEDASRFGTIECDGQGTLLAFREKRPGRGTINAGVYVFRHSVLSEFPADRPLSFETDVFPRLLISHRVAVVKTAAPFLDIGTESTLPEAERFLRENMNRIGGPSPASTP